MSLRWAMSGGNFFFSKGPTAAGVWAVTTNLSLSAAAPAGFSGGFAHAGGGATATTFNLGGNFTTLYVGYRINFSSFTASQVLLQTLDSTSVQTELRYDGTGLLYFSRNGVNLGTGNPTKSTKPLILNSTQYVEMKVIHATNGTGTAEVRVNNTVVLTVPLIQTAFANATANTVRFTVPAAGGFASDFYVVDGDAGTQTSYLGDITVAEIYPNGQGVNAQWTANVGPFTLTSVNGTGVYQGTITGGVSNAYQGYYFTVTGFTTGGNNTTALCTASTATSLTLSASTTIETHAGTATFQCIVQAGIHGGIVDGGTTTIGTRPNDNVAYVLDSTANDISDFSHQTLSLTGSIAGVVHVTYAGKNDSGARQIQQTCLSSGTSEVSSTISLGTSFQYYLDVLENDPHTSAAWLLAGFNAATFGCKEIT